MPVHAVRRAGAKTGFQWGNRGHVYPTRAGAERQAAAAHAHGFHDRAPRSPASEFLAARKSERGYVAQLRKVAQHVGDIVNGFDPADFAGMVFLQEALQRYSDLLTPWARSVAARMITEVAARDRHAWERVSEQIGRNLRREIATAPTGEAMRQLLAAQVDLITSIPLEAAQRVHGLTLEGISNGGRAAEIASRIRETSDVTKNRAMLIARTEVARTASVLTQVRATHIGSTHFIWRTAGDAAVRPSHRALNGKAFRWDQPPLCDEPNHRALPGQIWNCRCVAEPIIPED